MDLRAKGSDFVFEVQLTLTGVFILKKSEQKIYTLARMASAEELLGTFVFSELHEFVVPKQKADGSPSSAKEARVNTDNGVVLVQDKDGDTRFEAIQSTSAEDLEVDVNIAGFMTGGEYRLLASANFTGLVMGLYRSQILQENMRWKALAEIYTMHSFAPFCKLSQFR